MEKNMFKGGLKVLVTLAMLVALSSVFGKFMSVDITPYLRIGFENLPIILSGIIFGPLAGFVTGVASDLLGCLLKGFPVNFIITLASGVIGFAAAILRHFIKGVSFMKIWLITIIPHFISTIILRTVGLCVLYGNPWQIIFLRAPFYIVWGTLEAFLIYTFYRKNIMKQLGAKY
ncbi:MAG: folate family ECF transporter S component [Ruminococcaceae bacterium]|nr:folate family ECF transporter S component [Oscillospiraceae bacterium]